MRLRLLAGLGAAAVVLIALTTGWPGQANATGSHTTQLPVSYNFLQNTITVNTAASAPGENDWTCKPSAAHPRPVVLVHGTAGNAATNWVTYAALLHDKGYCVYALTYGVASVEASSPIKFGGMNDIVTSAREMRTFVAKVLSNTRATKIDLIGHSQGTYMPNYWIRWLGGARYVHDYISLAPLWAGTGTSSASQLNNTLHAFGTSTDKLIPVCTACGQMITGSDFAKKMASGVVAAPQVSYLNISTKYDELVMPYTSGQLSGYANMKNVVLQNYCPSDFTEHFEVASDPNAAQFVLAFLNNNTVPKTISCKT
ncbi:MAG TPA: lipase, partial [Marmoricola sp.]|nr:lipase [Marmoricola sp.]